MKLSFSKALEMTTCYDWVKIGLENTTRYVNQKNYVFSLPYLIN